MNKLFRPFTLSLFLFPSSLSLRALALLLWARGYRGWEGGNAGGKAGSCVSAPSSAGCLLGARCSRAVHYSRASC
ncbi:hypothetical protein CgunFtcFv8_020353 [Champsocephalus gunnari]|uniref:Uncharacterized protein n=1 Tax=Champsocephalus gunnari TaxID=52237 RepID=A0AAN8EM24_CHAGU|nr:hypothetical protein CgunFtcFv8_020353 [Champsocephalus gunnari]